jgi:predicted ATPase/signal transduction histidine kinase/tRNA A-37 threonylcarbamoyl transferase component Bud32
MVSTGRSRFYCNDSGQVNIMLSLSHYTITGEIHSGVDTVIYRGYRNLDRASVALKLVRSEYPSSRQIAKLRHEYAITKDLELAGIVRAYGLERVGNNLALVTENLEARPLNEVLRTEALPLRTALQIADSITDAIESIHRRDIIHKDIKPHNILVHMETCCVKLIDFGIATRLSQEMQRASSPELLEGTLAYMSPEQTGRMNRTLDHRTDLYSLGVTLYEMLTGALPFQATDPLELVHSHIARQPTPPQKLSASIPEAVSSIVMKLLAKAAEDRYQSASGLKADLRECLVQLAATGHITPFPLGRHDHGHGLLIPQKLYGREVETAALLAAWDHASGGAAELVLVAGYAGIGKSALVHELYKVIAGRRAYFITGKFDQLNRSVPYASLAQAFRELIRHLCAERAEELAVVRRKLAGALGQSGQVLVDLIPELELVIGKQPSVPELNSTEAQNRFNLVFQNFLRVFTTAEHPLVLFLDDLQWADLASLKLLSLLLSDPESGHLLVIGAYRDNEVDAGHPLSTIKTEIRQAGTNIVEITLGALHLPDVNQLITDALGCDKQRAAPLSKLVFDKTQGNPFFMNQFLLSLYKDQWLTFDASSGSFSWDLDRIQRASSTDNVVDFMAKKLRRLTPNTQRVLRLAACIGFQFDLRTLSTIDERPPVETAADLWEALRENIVQPLDAEYRFLHAEDQDEEGTLPLKDINISYRFLHDRVQQAAYSLIEDSKRRAVHLRIGRLLYASTQGSAREDVLLDLVNHLNFGAPLLTDPDERLDLARLNLVAGKRVKAATAYQAAASYLAEGMNLLSANSWEHDYELCFDLHAQRAECEYLNGRFEEAEALFEIILSRVRSDLERAHIYDLRMILYSTLGKMADTVRVGLTGLALFGVTFPEDERAQEAALAAALAEIGENLGQRRIEDLVHAPVITDPVQRMIMKLLATVSAPASFITPTFFALIIATEVNLALKYGHTEVSAYVYASYGMILTGIMAGYREAYAFGTLAMDLNEKFNNVDQTCKLSNVFGSFISYFSRPLRESLDLFERGNQAGLETGDFTFVSYNCLQFPMMRLGLGDELSAVRAQCDKLLTLMQRTKDAYSTGCLTAARQMIENLTGRTHGRGTLSDEQFDEGAFVVEIERVGLTHVVCWYYTIKAVLAVLYGDYTGALQMAAKAEERPGNTVGFFFVTDLCFYTCLALTALSPSASADQRERYAAMLVARQAKLALWAEHCPENFRHKYLLISAEQARVSGDEIAAMNLYEQAIQTAHESEFLHHEALSNELAAKFHLAKGRTKMARAHMRDAVYGYARWGAEAKVAQLKEKYGELLPRGADRAKAAGPTHTATITGATEVLDLATVMKASQAVSGEIELGKLLERLMRTAMENAGANKGYLLLVSDEDLRVEAAAQAEQVEGQAVRVLQSVPLKDEKDLSQAVVRYVQKTRERVVLANAANESMFMSDAYMAQKKPKSLLCAPIVQQGKLLGILYLENTLIEGAFTPERLEVLQILSAQAAISIENSRLYGTLEEKVRARTAELRDVQAKLLQLEREATERRMAGGFAHEIRNALAGAKLVLARALGQDDSNGRASLPLDSAAEIAKLHEELNECLAEAQMDPFTKRFQHIFENQESIDSALQLVFRAISRALFITKKIMDFSKIADADRAKDWISVNEVIDSVTADLRETLRGANISVQTDIQGSINILADQAHGYSILQNLLNNARDAIFEGGASGAGVIEVKARTEGEACVLTVTDNGVGIREEDMAKIFESFYSTKPEGGTGLGLAVVKKIVDVNGGTIEVQSEWGKGSQFTVTLPIAGPAGVK